jgi:hypothetical protein
MNILMTSKVLGLNRLMNILIARDEPADEILVARPGLSHLSGQDWAAG